MSREVLGAFFRDPGGFVFLHEGELYRQVNHSCGEDYDALMSPGLYAKRVGKGLLISHEEVSPPAPAGEEHARTLRPGRL